MRMNSRIQNELQITCIKIGTVLRALQLKPFVHYIGLGFLVCAWVSGEGWWVVVEWSRKWGKWYCRMPPKRMSTYEAPAMTQAAIRQLVVDSVAAALANADNANRNPEPRESPVAKKCSYKEFMSCQPFNFKGSEGAIGLIYWIEEAYKITWVEFKKFMIKKYCPRTEIQKMEDEFYHLTMKGNDLKTYVRRLKELATLCPTMVSNSKKLLEAFIGGLPRSIEGNVTASKPQGCTLTLLNEPFEIDLMPIKPGSFDVIIDEKRLEDIPVVKEFLDIFPKDLPGLSPIRQVEFQIDLISGTTPIARAPYRLAPSEMQELSNQLQELIDRGFI
uniref:Reverse transcriptase domain-containing protein n=1 Tax=Tanacetum cinerariifolium TaxID=118510 RepID=A0A699IKX5_TANCI|nr:reverse transcriptase domain-containing protein [Tanacetum cinerariifolium]